MSVRTRAARVFAAVGVLVALAVSTTACAGGGAAGDPLPTSVKSSFPEQIQTQLHDTVTAAMAATGSSGAIVGVWAPWSGSWTAGLGTIAPGSKTPVTTDMTFRIGAATRPMICDALYQLADAGTVKLSDSVTEYVGGMPKFTGVTLESLCDGTSGIGSYGAMLNGVALSNPDRQWSPRELVGYGVGAVHGDVHPGVSYSDSDAGYLLLGLALEAASGQSAADLLQQRVFGPLGLRDTRLPGSEPAAPVVGSSDPLEGFYLTTRDEAGAYVCDKQANVTEQSASFGFTDSGVVSDIQDLGTYVKALASGALVKDKKRFADAWPAVPGAPTWFTAAGGAIQAGPLIGQYGAVAGYLTAAFSDPKSGLTVAVVLNNSTAGRDAAINLAQGLAAIASKAPASEGHTAPALGLPWNAEQAQGAIARLAVCPPPPAE